MHIRLEHKPFWGLIAIAAIGFFGLFPSLMPAHARAQVGAELPAFTDEAGSEQRLSALEGRVVIVNLWATWCAPCVEEMPSLSKLQERYKEQGLVVLALSQDAGGVAAVKAFYHDNNITNLPVYLDKGSALFRAAKAPGLPTSLIIDREGNIHKVIPGKVDWVGKPITQMVESLLTN